jgi:hypothetical protein
MRRIEHDGDASADHGAGFYLQYISNVLPCEATFSAP